MRPVGVIRSEYCASIVAVLKEQRAMYRLTSHFIAQIIQVVETVAYHRMLVRIQLEREIKV